MRREARQRYGVEPALLSIRGTLLTIEVDEATRLAERINREREAARFPETAVRTGELLAAGLLHELQHLLLQVAREARPRAFVDLLDGFRRQVGAARADALIAGFMERFPSPGGADDEGDRQAEAERVVSDPEEVLEELLLLRLAIRNPALERFHELFDPSGLSQEDIDALWDVGRGVLRPPGQGGGGGEGADGDGPRAHGPGSGADGLLALLEAPLLAHPTSLDGQLRYASEAWRPLLGERLAKLLGRLLLSLDIMDEERKPGFLGPGEVVVPGADELLGRGSSEQEPRFSRDAAWMQDLVIIAKSTYVWLDQLSRRYHRPIRTLADIPDEELRELSERGFNGLWLIGLWERSEASRRIKQLRGQEDAVASAYSVHDYRIADDLGGEEAYRRLHEKAARLGIRLASDMVPNHVGIDARWVVEHPDWFIGLDHPPYPGYTFDGPDLSSDPRVQIFLEDHYYDSSDAAVVFKRVDRASGSERFIYHGNDGTAMPWNDTAQLDYLNAEVREAVIRTILDVARRFPVIRFDAAMTLARQHVRRLWHPEPGHGGAIPSRAKYGSMSDEEFDRLMPTEFWREVVDRIAAEAPDTLLLAEAFWMLEGYFVRTLGMHRVYNSAFMHMTAKEANADHRRLIREILEFEPEILGRLVNFMNNPDEETAAVQFGKGDKYFGVCTLLVTLPGLPMFGHGQVEGFEEKYGMEFRRARHDESPDPLLLERHRREIFPLLHRRRVFAGVERFRLYDFLADEGGVNEDVYAYSNGHGDDFALVLYNNRYERSEGRLGHSVPIKDGSGGTRSVSLFEELGLDGGPDRVLVFRDARSGLEHVTACEDVRSNGLRFALDGYQSRVLIDFRELRDATGEPYCSLARELAGRGVPSVQDAVLDLHLRPVFDAWGDLLDTPIRDEEALVGSYVDLLEILSAHGLTMSRHDWDVVRERFAALAAACDTLGRSPAPVAQRLLDTQALLLPWLALEPLPDGTLERFRLERELLAGEHIEAGRVDADTVAELLPLLLSHVNRKGSPFVRLAGLLDDPRAGSALRLNEHEEVTYFNREAFRMLADSLVLAAAATDLVDSGVATDVAERLKLVTALEDESRFEVERLRAALAVTGRKSARPSGASRSGG